jgi:hypothetical protein
VETNVRGEVVSEEVEVDFFCCGELDTIRKWNWRWGMGMGKGTGETKRGLGDIEEGEGIGEFGGNTP